MYILSPTTHSSLCFFFLMIRRPPRSTLDRSSAASDVYKRQEDEQQKKLEVFIQEDRQKGFDLSKAPLFRLALIPVSYTHLRAHETVLDLVCRLLLEKKKTLTNNLSYTETSNTKIHTNTVTHCHTDRNHIRENT